MPRWWPAAYNGRTKPGSSHTGNRGLPWRVAWPSRYSVPGPLWSHSPRLIKTPRSPKLLNGTPLGPKLVEEERGGQVTNTQHEGYRLQQVPGGRPLGGGGEGTPVLKGLVGALFYPATPSGLPEPVSPCGKDENCYSTRAGEDGSRGIFCDQHQREHEGKLSGEGGVTPRPAEPAGARQAEAGGGRHQSPATSKPKVSGESRE